MCSESLPTPPALQQPRPRGPRFCLHMSSEVMPSAAASCPDLTVGVDVGGPELRRRVEERERAGVPGSLAQVFPQIAGRWVLIIASPSGADSSLAHLPS